MMSAAEEAEVLRTHVPFIVKHAKKWRRLEHEDAMQIAGLALVVACRTWTPEGGANIRTYSSSGLYWRLRYADKVENRGPKTTSIDAEIDEEGESHDTLHDVIGNPATQENELDAKRLRARIDRAMRRLLPREREVISMRFLEDMTLEECGVRCRRTRERMRQIQNDALAKLRELLADEEP